MSARKPVCAVALEVVDDIAAACASRDEHGGCRRAKTVPGERRWRAEQRMREMQQDLDTQERERAAAPASVSAVSGAAPSAGAASGGSSGERGPTEGRIELLSLRLRLKKLPPFWRHACAQETNF